MDRLRRQRSDVATAAESILALFPWADSPEAYAGAYRIAEAIHVHIISKTKG